MILGRVCGTLHSTINHPFYDGHRILMADRLDRSGKPTGDYILAIDTVDAGAGETVMIIDEGNSARQIVGDDLAPLRSIIVGVVADFTALEENK